jgi:uncharacterized protein YbjT (DUF2867 family)
VTLRPVFFMQNMKSFFAPDANGNFYVAMSPNRKLQMIAVADIGKYGRLAFDKAAELNGQAIDIAGDELSMADAAKIISEASGKPATHVRANIEDVRAYSADMALMFEWFESTGYNVDIAANERKYGIKPTSFKEWAKSAY